jgi:hypothetical protein
VSASRSLPALLLNIMFTGVRTCNAFTRTG